MLLFANVNSIHILIKNEMNTVEIYSKWWCGYCRMAKALLKKEGIAYEEIDVTFGGEKEAEMIKRSGRRTVPQIFIKNESIGGFTDLAKLSTTMDLRALVSSDNEQPG
jgi:GrxC family glutaredoxin